MHDQATIIIMSKDFLASTVSHQLEQRFLWAFTNQSRFWENQIGRTTAFWHVAMPWFREQFPDCPDWSNEVLDLVANEVKPDFIRVEADEVTYNLHIVSL